MSIIDIKTKEITGGGGGGEPPSDPPLTAECQQAITSLEELIKNLKSGSVSAFAVTALDKEYISYYPYIYIKNIVAIHKLNRVTQGLSKTLGMYADLDIDDDLGLMEDE